MNAVLVTCVIIVVVNCVFLYLFQCQLHKLRHQESNAAFSLPFAHTVARMLERWPSGQEHNFPMFTTEHPFRSLHVTVYRSNDGAVLFDTASSLRSYGPTRASVRQTEALDAIKDRAKIHGGLNGSVATVQRTCDAVGRGQLNVTTLAASETTDGRLVVVQTCGDEEAT